MPHPKDVARFPQQAGSAASGNDARCRPVASRGGQHCRTTGAKPSRASRSSGDKAVADARSADRRRPPSGARKQSSSTNDVLDRLPSSSAPVRAPPPPRAPLRSLPSPSAVPPGTARRQQLRDRLERLRLRRGDVTQNKDTVHELCKDIRQELERNGHQSLGHWEIMNSGSYYDKTKV